MTDKQIPDWAIAKAVEYFNQSPKHHPLHRVLLDDIYSKARELSAQQPDAARGERPIKVLGQSGDPYPTAFVGETSEQLARDGDNGVRAATAQETADIDRAAGLSLLQIRLPDALIDAIHAQAKSRGIIFVAAVRELLKEALSSESKPQPADDEAICEVTVTPGWGSRDEISVKWFPQFQQLGHGHYRLYLRPARGVEVTEDAVERLAQFIYRKESADCKSLDEALSHQNNWRRAIPEAREMLQAALSGVK